MGLANAFAVFLYISFYVANLTSLTTNANSASVQAALEYSPVTSIKSFESPQYYGCVQNHTNVLSFLQKQYPTVCVCFCFGMRALSCALPESCSQICGMHATSR